MRILVISNVPWDVRNSYGNTVSNWFEGWEDDVFSSIYCRQAPPFNTTCSNYYTVPPLALFKDALRPGRIGMHFDNEHIAQFDADGKETSIINHAHQGGGEWMYLLSDLMYAAGCWRNKRYKEFIRETNPDIVFSFGISDSFIYENYSYIKKHTNAKIVTFVADDVYGAYIDGKKFRNHLQACRFRKMMKMSDRVYGASEELCDAYQKLFGVSMIPLYKGCLPVRKKDKVGNPLRLVYCGNLLWGRDKLLSMIADSLAEINAEEMKATLEIYTGSFVTSEMKGRLNRGESSKVMGRRTYDEIMEIMHDADLALQVESFEEKMKKTVRYSFSTKITDCLQSGVPMMVIGPSGISSVEYSRRIPGVIVIDDPKEITSQLTQFVNESDALLERVTSISDFAQKHHNLSTIKQTLRNDFVELLKGAKS